MALQNSIAKKQQSPSNKVVEYKVGDETVKLSPSIIRNYLVNGGGNVTDQEVAMFLNLCRFQHLNPFLREAYLIKYGNQPATMVVGKEAILKRAMKNPSFGGMQAGVVVQHLNNLDELEYRTGSLVIAEAEKLVGGWAKVYVKGYQVPIEAVVSFSEYVGVKKDGTVNSQWANKPATMIRKTALVQALREAFPDDVGGMYDQSEVGVEINESTMGPVEIENSEPAAAIEQPQMEEAIPQAEESKDNIEELATF